MVGVATASAPVPPASGTDSARPSAGAEPPSQLGEARSGAAVTRPGPALGDEAFEDRSDVRGIGSWIE